MPGREPEDVRAALLRWRHLNVNQGLIETEPIPGKSSIPQHECGVSVSWLLQFMGSLKTISSVAEDTASIVSKVIAPCTKFINNNRFRFFNLIPNEYCGKPNYYVVHYWGDSLHTVIENVRNYLAPPPSPNNPTPPPPEKILERTYVWLDVMVVPQHGTATLELADVRKAITSCDKGSLVVMDPDLTLLTRVWAMYEAWATVYYGDCQRLKVVFPGDLTLQQVSLFQEQCGHMELVRGDSSKLADRQRIISEVKHTVGIKRMQSLLPSALMRSARHGLKWSGELRHVSMYCSILLRSGELNQVQQTLHAIPEIHDDEKMLQDIRDVFKLYDTDGSGELDEDEFIEVLGVAGFQQDEAKEIFGKVDVDGGGSVSLAEFEKWWIESQRQQNNEYHHKVELTLDALVSNLKAFMSLLERKDLASHAEFFEEWVHRLCTGRVARVKAALQQPSAVQGDWRPVAEQCAWRVNQRDYHMAAKLMYDMLMWNADTLPVPPSDLVIPPPGAESNQAILETVVSFFDMFANLLSRIPGNIRQAEYFYRAARELREGPLAALIAPDNGAEGTGVRGPGGLMMMRRRKKATGRGSPKLFPGKYDMEREAIVTNMVKLKYGDSTLISNQLIVEAEKSLSQWMAAQKQMATAKRRTDVRDDVDMMARAYLGAMPTTGDEEEGLGTPKGAARSSTSKLPAIKGAGGGDAGGGGFGGRSKSASAALPPIGRR